MGSQEHVPENAQAPAAPVPEVASAAPISAGPMVAGPFGGAWAGVPYASPGSRGSLNRATIMFLQRTAGNQAVSQLVARQPAAPPGPEPPPTAAPPPPAAAPPPPAGSAPPVAAPPSAAAPPAAVPPSAAAPPAAAPPTGTPGTPPGGPDGPVPVTGPPTPKPPAPGPTPKVDPTQAPPTPTPAAKQPTTSDPSSGIDWAKWWDDPNNKMSVARVPLEVLRAYPGYGLLAGGAADALNVYQDFRQISGEDAPFIKGIMATRSAILIINNAIGHIVYVDQFVQDGLTVSVVGIEFTPLSMAVNDLLKGLKVYLDTCMIFMDFGLMCGAAYRAQTAPPGSNTEKNFAAMFGNYAANTLGSMINFVIDIIDLATGGFAHGEVVKTGVGAINAILKGAVNLKPIIRSIILGWLGIFGGTPLTPDARPAPAAGDAPSPSASGPATAPPAGGPTPAVARMVQRLVADGMLGPGAAGLGKRAAAEIILAELQQIKAAYTTGDFLLGAAGEYMSTMLTQLREAATKANDGKDPFIMARDGASKALADLGQKMGEFAQMEEMSKTAEQYAGDVGGMADSVLALVNGLKVPDVKIPESDVGEGVLADAAEGILNAAGSLAEGGLQALVDQINELVEGLKPTVREPVEAVKGHAGEVGAFAKIVQDQARTMIKWGEDKTKEVSEALSKCNSFEDFINLMVSQVMQMLGMEGDFKVDDVRAGWAALGAEIDQAIVWAQGLRDGTAADEDEDGQGAAASPAASAPPATSATPPAAPPSQAAPAPAV